MTRRTDRINGVLRQEISLLISRELRDPRLSGVVSITQVETSADLRFARVHVSVLGSSEQKQKVLQGIDSASNYMRKELGTRLYIRYVPKLSFVLDESLDKADRVYRLMDRISGDPPSATTPQHKTKDAGPAQSRNGK